MTRLFAKQQNISDAEAIPWANGDWYLCDGQKISGPFSAEEVFQGEKEKTGMKVSRKGFKRWYPLKDFSRLFDAAQKGELTSAEETDKITLHLANELERLEKLIPEDQRDQLTRRSKKVKAKEISLPQQTRDASESIGQSSLASLAGVKKEASISYNLMIVSGRLRLGPLLSPRREALWTMLSFGLYWLHWFKQTTLFVKWHVENTYPRFGFKKQLALFIPLLHMVAVYKLAKKILNMECQNNYRSTSPTIAFLLAAFPPLAVLYLQRALNRHWRLHVHFEMSRPQKKKSKKRK